jgi:LPXTG-site transpeptidase (sortase) family protein
VNARRLLPWAVAVLVVCALGLGVLVVGSLTSESARWESSEGADPTTGPVGPPPERVRIPSIGVDSTLEDLGLDTDGALAAPKDYARAGWYVDGTRPGDVGPAVIAGHVDSRTGPAVFFRLHQLKQGDVIEVTRRGGDPVKFKVLAVRKYPKQEFPTDEVYAPVPNAQLRLITCGGAFDQTRRSYVDNVVVYAVAM